MDTAALPARIVRTGIAIITGKTGSRDTGSILTGITQRTGIAIGAIGEISSVEASCLRVTAIVRADLVIITIDSLAHAGAILAVVPLGAG